MKKVVIIGGGVCGLFAAYFLKTKYPDYKVQIIEKDSECGKRIKVSGNGRCNFNNLNLSKKKYKNGERIEHIINDFKNVQDEIYQDLNLHYYADEEGRMYPISNSSKTVHYLLLDKLKELGVEFHNDFIVNIDKQCVYGNNRYPFDYLIIACGGQSYLYQEDNIKFLNNLKLKLNPFFSSLCPISVNEKIPSSIVGKRAKAQIKIKQNDNTVFSEEGEILFKKDGLSGIVIFNVSSYIARHFKDNKFDIYVDFCPNIDITDLYIEKSKFGIEKTIKSYLVEEIASYILSFKNPIEQLKSLKYTFKSLYPLKESQVSCGGIDLNEINLNDLSLKKYPNIYVGGEILDVDGDCGGYNIAFAQACAYFIAKNLK